MTKCKRAGGVGVLALWPPPRCGVSVSGALRGVVVLLKRGPNFKFLVLIAHCREESTHYGIHVYPIVRAGVDRQ